MILKEYQKPDYYRKEFEGIRGKIYDFLFGLSLFGFQKKIREKIFLFFKNEPREIIELACGTGSETILIKKRYPKAKVYGVDLSKTMLRKALKKTKKENLIIDYRLKDIENTFFPEDNFDMVIICFALHEMPSENAKKVLREAYRITKPGGKFIIMEISKPKNPFFRFGFKLYCFLNEPFAKDFFRVDLSHQLMKIGFKKVQKAYAHNNLIQYLKVEK